MDKKYQHLNSPKALELMKQVQEIYWDKIEPIRLKTYISSVLKIDDSEKFDFIAQLQETFPFLSKHMFVLHIPPEFASPIHLDDSPPEREKVNGKRLFSINIPIEGCDETCPTELFEVAPEHLIYLKYANLTGVIPGSPTKLVDQYVLKDCPILLNTQIPHRSTNRKIDGYRLSVSWTVKDTWSWEEVINYLEP